MIAKTELRKQAKEIRSCLDIENISKKIVENIKNLDVYKNAKHIMIFYPLKHEVNLLGLLEDNKQFYLPKINGKNLHVCPYKKGDELIDADFKTKEPITDPIDIKILDILFIPALMADTNFNRLGYGGGFYDRFLADNRLKASKIIAIPSALMAETLPSEAFDIKSDIIVCEEMLRVLKSH